MKRFILCNIWGVFITLICLSCSQDQTMSDNVFPFGLEYDMSEDDVYTILDSLISVDEVKYDEEIGYLYPFNSSYYMRILLGFYEGKLGTLELTSTELDHNYGTLSNSQIKRFLKKEGINLKKWKFEKPREKKYAFIKRYSKSDSYISFSYKGYTHISFRKYGTKAEIVDVYQRKRASERIDQYSKENSNYTGSGKVSNSPWDGSVYQVKNYLKRNYSSYESVSWGAVHFDNTVNKYYVEHTFKAQNALGGLSMFTKVFELDNNGKLLSITDL